MIRFRLVGVELYCVGPLVPIQEETKQSHFTLQDKVMKWLANKPSKSVIYVAFGTMATPKPADKAGIITALREIGQPYIWAMPRSEQDILPEDMRSKVATQFDDPMSPSLILDWTPQKAILQHPAMAVFLTHCGWNSALESLAGGVPTVAWPMCAEQKDNAEELVRAGTGWLIKDTGYFSEKVTSAEEIKEALMGVTGFGGKSFGETPFQVSAQKWKKTLLEVTGENGDSQKDFQRLISHF